MVTTAYDVGDNRRLSVTFKDIAGTETDPTVVTFKMREPDGALTTFVYPTDSELVRTAAGKFQVDWPIAKQGRHVGAWVGTGAAETMEEFEFYARASDAV